MEVEVEVERDANNDRKSAQYDTSIEAASPPVHCHSYSDASQVWVHLTTSKPIEAGPGPGHGHGRANYAL